MIWSLRHDCVLFSVCSCSVWRSEVLIWCWLRLGMSVLGCCGSADRMCGMDGCTVGMAMVVGGGNPVLWWGYDGGALSVLRDDMWFELPVYDKSENHKVVIMIFNIYFLF